ncbi:hypothetical protein CE195_10150, partial [Sodalis-like symbiont of Philaenus spumarius]
MKFVRLTRRTRETETSQHPEKKKSTKIPPVAASKWGSLKSPAPEVISPASEGTLVVDSISRARGYHVLQWRIQRKAISRELADLMKVKV